MGGSSGGMSGSGGMGGASGWPQDPDQVLNESMGDFDGTIAGEREVLAKSGGGEAKSAGGREQRDSESVKDAGMGQGSGGMADASGGESASGGSAGSAGSAGAAGGASGEQSGSQSAGAEGSQAGGGSGSTNAQRSGRDSNASDRDGANVANIPDDIPIDGSGDDQVAEQIREAAMQEEDPVIRDALWEEYRKHTGIR